MAIRGPKLKHIVEIVYNLRKTIHGPKKETCFPTPDKNTEFVSTLIFEGDFLENDGCPLIINNHRIHSALCFQEEKLRETEHWLYAA